MGAAQEKRTRLQKRWEALKTVRASWMTRWRDIAAHQAPTAFREVAGETNIGNLPKWEKIINFTPRESARTMAAGLMTGISSPSRPWFRLDVDSPDGASLGETSQQVKQWLDGVAQKLRAAFAKSNFYRGLNQVYGYLGPFGVAAQLLDEDEDDVLRAYTYPMGTYCLDTGARGDVDTFFHELSMTVRQVVQLFGLNACSRRVKELHGNGKLEERVEVLHAIYPNDDYVEGGFAARGKRWASDWWEAQGDAETGLLRESGYEEFPVQAPRWEVCGEDVYGTGPGWDALGDCKALQLYERRSAQAADKVVTPPMAAPTSARNQPFDLTPGGMNFVDALGVNGALRPAIEVRADAVQVFELKIQRHEDRVRRAFYAHLWLLLTDASTPQMTAREVDERSEEKMQQLGAVLEGLHDELLDPAIARAFSILWRRGLIPLPPEELQGQDWKVEYISILAQAQKALATVSLNRLATFIGNLSNVPALAAAADKLDVDALVDEYGNALGVPPSVVRTTDAVAQLRQRRAAAAQQQQALEQAQAGAATAKSLAQSPLDENNALNAVLRSVGVR